MASNDPSLAQSEIFITIAICTFNRAESLRRTLRSLSELEVPNSIKYEIIIVNNNCNDHTDDVIASFSDRLPVRREFEPQRGLSWARNHAIHSSKGNYIVWTDDDVVVDPHWTAAYAQAFVRWPSAAVFSGPIVPRYVQPVPKWIADGEAVLGHTVFAGCDFGDSVLPLSTERIPWGPNFALRMTEQRANLYDTRFGHAPGQSRRGEEVEVMERILRSGATGYWVPGARVEHYSQPEHQTLEYVMRWFSTFGETLAFREGTRGSPLLFGVPRWLWRRFIEGWFRYQICQYVSPASIWVVHLRDYRTAWGAIRQFWRMRVRKIRNA
jgi:glycosyltransferase involved in cell wall biosynthesis